MKSENRAETADRLFTELYPPLMKDAHTAFKKAREHPNDYNKRVAFRVAFSAIEGLVYILKDNALAGSHADTSYSPAELALLREEDYQLNDRGIATIRPRFLRIADNLLFAWKMYFRDVLPDFKPDLSGNGWSSFSSSLVIRNRITHPKSGDDLLISVEDLAKLEAGFDWVVQTTFRNMAGAILRMRFLHNLQLRNPQTFACTG